MTAWVDWILAGMLAEGLLLTLVWRRTGQGVPPGALLPNLLAGAMLLGAMRLALSQAAWYWVSLCLLGGLAGHVGDLIGRWRPRT